MSDHYSIRFEAALICPRSKDSVMYTTRRTGPATVLALNEKLPATLALVNTDTDSVEYLTSGVNIVFSRTNVHKNLIKKWGLSVVY